MVGTRWRSGRDVHLLKLFVDFDVVFVVFDELDYERTVGECEELCVLAR